MNHRLLTINYTKTFFMPFSCYSDRLPHYKQLQIDLGKQTIKIDMTEKMKYLGIIIDSHLRWNYHIDHIVKKLRSMLSKFKYLRDILDIEQLRILYYALIQPHINYGILAWGGIMNNYLKKLEITQKWLLKVIYKRNYTYPTTTLYEETEILDQRQLFFLSMTINLFKNKEHINTANHNIETRSRANFQPIVPKMKKTIGQRSYSYLSSFVYANIPLNIRNIKSLPLYKRKVKNWLKSTSRIKILEIIDRKNYAHLP